MLEHYNLKLLNQNFFIIGHPNFIKNKNAVLIKREINL